MDRTPIVEAHPVSGAVSMTIDPFLRGRPVLEGRLKMMLAAVCGTSNVCSALQDTPADIMVYTDGSSDAGLGWATADALNRALMELPQDPVLVVRESSQDMVLHVVVAKGKYCLVDYHAWQLRELLQPYGVENVQIAPPSIYSGRVLDLFVPYIGIKQGVTVLNVGAQIRTVLSFRLYDGNEGDETVAIP